MALSTGPAGQPGKEIARGKGWTSVAIDGDVIWIAQGVGKAGALLQTGSEGAPKLVIECQGRPSGLLARDGKLYWAERRAGSPGAPIFIPTLSDQVVACVRESDGKVRDLASWPAGAESRAEGHLPRVIAVSETTVYLRVPRLLSTEFIRTPEAGGAPERLAIERGVQQGALYGGRFHWTARSQEATSNVDMCRVMRLNSEGAEAGTETVAEWLPGRGSLVPMDDALYYVAEGVYRIPLKLAMPKRLGDAFVTLAAPDANGIVLVNRGGGLPPILFLEK